MEERSDRPQRLSPACFPPPAARADPALWCTSPTRLEHLSATPPVAGPNTTPLRFRPDRAGIQPDVGIVPPSRDKRRRVPESLHQLKPQNPAGKSQRPLKVSYRQVDMPHPDTSIDRRIVHTDSMTSASIAHYWPAK